MFLRSWPPSVISWSRAQRSARNQDRLVRRLSVQGNGSSRPKTSSRISERSGAERYIVPTPTVVGGSKTQGLRDAVNVVRGNPPGQKPSRLLLSGSSPQSARKPKLAAAPYSPTEVAAKYALLGDQHNAFRWLEKPISSTTGSLWSSRWIRNSTACAPTRATLTSSAASAFRSDSSPSRWPRHVPRVCARGRPAWRTRIFSRWGKFPALAIRGFHNHVTIERLVREHAAIAAYRVNLD
jgi:hypothetical protein